MSMYLPNDDVRPTGDEAAEFIDVPETAEDEEELSDELGSEESADQRPNG